MVIQLSHVTQYYKINYRYKEIKPVGLKCLDLEEDEALLVEKATDKMLLEFLWKKLQIEYGYL